VVYGSVHHTADVPVPQLSYGGCVTVAVFRSHGRVRSPRAFDALLAGGVAVVSLGALLFKHPDPGQHAYDIGAWLLAGAAAASLAARRRQPLYTFAVTFGAVVVWFARDYPPAPIVLPVVIALFTVGETGDRRRSAIVGIGVICFGVLIAAFHARHGLDAGAIIAGFGWLGTSLFAGDAIRNRRAYVLAIEQRAHDAEQSREEEARRRVDEERLRIARELHDVVAHSIATINVQAGVAAHVMDRQPEQARAALIAIKEASREALRELRATLTVLRESDDTSAPRAPAPGLGQLELLVESTRGAGLPISLIGEPDAMVVPPTVGLTAYRIVQEALTNVLRHAGDAHATVRVDMFDDRLIVDVADNGSGVANGDARAQTGHGLAGMRERVRAVGGSLEVGPNEGRGFRVHAELPILEARG
jgi:signal transduction histidine kinase